MKKLIIEIAMKIIGRKKIVTKNGDENGNETNLWALLQKLWAFPL